MPSYITAIETANPEHKLSQNRIAEFMKSSHEMEQDQAHHLDVLYRASGIQTRYTVLSDYGLSDPTEYSFFPKHRDLEPFPGVRDRMAVYEKAALPLTIKAIKKLEAGLDGVTHLITVSCTGMYAPGLDIEIIEHLHLPTSTQRTAINYMGCYAAFNALKLADHFCQNNPEAKVLIVCVELCSLHFQKGHREDSLLSNALFGDGAAAVVVQGKPLARCMEVRAFHCDLATVGKKEMAWQISDFGFEMKLSSYVPDIIKEGIGHLTQTLLQKLNLGDDQIDHYAIHPGGKKILQAIESELGITREDNCHAYKTLRDYGNMSSPTVLFVLRSIMDSINSSDDGQNILSFAFGPGLTLESMLLKIHA